MKPYFFVATVALFVFCSGLSARSTLIHLMIPTSEIIFLKKTPLSVRTTFG